MPNVSVNNIAQTHPTRRILVIRLSAMGDVLLATPLIRWVKIQYPQADVDFLVKSLYTPLVRSNPHLNQVISLSADLGWRELVRVIRAVRVNRYDLVLDLQVNLRSWLIRHLCRARQTAVYRPNRWKRFNLVYARRGLDESFHAIPLRQLASFSHLGIHDDGFGLDLVIGEVPRQAVAKALGGEEVGQEERIIVIAPGASRATKRWLPQRFAEVGQHFTQTGYRIILVGGSGDRNVCTDVASQITPSPINWVGQCTLLETAVLISRAACLITNDTGVMHIGAALKRPLVALFGPTSQHLGFFPFRGISTVIERQLDCRPCSYHGTARCPKSHFRCLLDIQSREVIEAAEALLERS